MWDMLCLCWAQLGCEANHMASIWGLSTKLLFGLKVGWRPSSTPLGFWLGQVGPLLSSLSYSLGAGGSCREATPNIVPNHHCRWDGTHQKDVASGSPTVFTQQVHQLLGWPSSPTPINIPCPPCHNTPEPIYLVNLAHMNHARPHRRSVHPPNSRHNRHSWRSSPGELICGCNDYAN